MPPTFPFSETDLQAIRSAVEEAERRTSGEIVPYVVPASDEYAGALWKGAAFGALAGAVVGWVVYHWGGFWGSFLFFWMTVPPALGGAAGYLGALAAPVRRWLAGGELLDLRCRERAAAAFLEQEVFLTRERTGILLFLSLLEHRVVVLGDSGINRRVEQREWDEVVRQVVAGSRGGRPGEALAAAIRECGALLERHGVARRPGDVDELANELRRGDS